MAELNKKEHANRIQTSILNPYEKVVLEWIANRLPKWVKSDYLSFLGFLGAVVIAVGYFLTNLSPIWMLLVCLGFIMNWLGDSLDGTIARVRHTQRPIYGFYLDHNLDCICEFLIVAGAGLSPFLNMWASLLIIAPYLMLEVYVMINAHLKNEFKLTYGKLGPTEFRIIIMVFSLAVLFESVRTWHVDFTIMQNVITLQFLDFFCLAVSIILFVMYFNSVLTDAKYFAKVDPLKKRE